MRVSHIRTCHCALAASSGPHTNRTITQMTRGWSTYIHNPYRAYACICPFIATPVLIIDFDCRPLPAQISWKSPSLHEVRAEEHEPALMLRQDAISVFWRRQTRQKPLTLTLTVHCFLLTTHVGNGCGSLRLHLLLDSFGSILHSLSQCLTVHCHLNLKVSQSNNNTRSNN